MQPLEHGQQLIRIVKQQSHFAIRDLGAGIELLQRRQHSATGVFKLLHIKKTAVVGSWQQGSETAVEALG